MQRSAVSSRLTLSLDYWHYKYKNQIQLKNGQAVINADPNGPNVIRDGSGVAQSIVISSYNAPSGTGTSGIDAAASYRFDIGAARRGSRCATTSAISRRMTSIRGRWSTTASGIAAITRPRR
ncbi:hypothetical protein [Sphingomonas sp. PvP056]|uniref:hypothetical protein n=1 Tax=Sphingomonas sp. PvP056 TaxID=3156392 RepID=UPI0033915F82